MLGTGFQTSAAEAQSKRCLFGLFAVVGFLVACKEEPNHWIRAKARQLRAAYGTRATEQETPQPLAGLSSAPALSRAMEAKPPEQRSQLAELSYRLPAPKRVVALGELPHGLSSARRALRMARVIDQHNQWIGGETIVVQLGNRGALATPRRNRRAEHEALDQWFAQLRRRAHDRGGDVVLLLGERDAAQLSEESAASLRLPPVLSVIVGNAAFVHAGLLPADLEDGLLALNQQLHTGLRGLEALLGEPRGPLRIPDYTYPYVPKPTCKRLTEVLGQLRVDRLIVGRNPAERGTTSACEGRLQRIGAAEIGNEVVVAEVLPSEVRRTRSERTKSLDRAP